VTPLFVPDWPEIDAALLRLAEQARAAGRGEEADHVDAVRHDCAQAAHRKAIALPDRAAIAARIRILTAAARFAARIAEARPWDDAACAHATALAQATMLLHPWDGRAPDPETPRTPRLHFNAAITAELRAQAAVKDERMAA
jgi:hypothetical protein